MATHWRVWYGTNPQRDRLAQLRHSASKRQARITCILASAKRTIGCTDCGFSDQRALQWDHVDPTIKLGNVGGMGNWSATWREMAKCVVRCANCHAIRTYEEGHTRRALT